MICLDCEGGHHDKCRGWFWAYTSSWRPRKHWCLCAHIDGVDGAEKMGS